MPNTANELTMTQNNNRTDATYQLVPKTSWWEIFAVLSILLVYFPLKRLHGWIQNVRN